MKVSDLAHDITYLETITKAVANTAANLLGDIADLKARIEQLPAIVTDVRIGPGDYHACPKDLAPMKQLADIVSGGGLVLVHDTRQNLYRLMSYDTASDSMVVTPFKNEFGRQTIPEAGKWTYGYIIYLKLNA